MDPPIDLVFSCIGRGCCCCVCSLFCLFKPLVTDHRSQNGDGGSLSESQVGTKSNQFESAFRAQTPVGAANIGSSQRWTRRSSNSECHDSCTSSGRTCRSAKKKLLQWCSEHTEGRVHWTGFTMPWANVALLIEYCSCTGLMWTMVNSQKDFVLTTTTNYQTSSTMEVSRHEFLSLLRNLSEWIRSFCCWFLQDGMMMIRIPDRCGLTPCMGCYS